KVRVWEPDTGHETFTFDNVIEDRPDVPPAFNHDGTRLAANGPGGSIRIWDGRTGEMIRPLEGHAGTAWSAPVLSPDGRTIASGDREGKIRIRELATGIDVFRPHTKHADAVRNLAFRSDGRLLASASRDRTVKIWEVATGRLLKDLHGHTKW